MKNDTTVLSFVLLFVLLAGCKALPERADFPASAGAPLASTQSYLEETEYLDSLLIHHQYFTLRDHMTSTDNRLPEHFSLYYKAQLQAAFNQRALSNKNLKIILDRYTDQLNDLKRVALLETAAANSLFLFDYQQALKYTQMLLDLELVEGQKRKEHLNNLKIY